MSFSVVIEKGALKDIQTAVNYYDERLIGLGKAFRDGVDKHFVALSKNPFYQLRYKDYRALPVKKFPFLILFYIVEKTKTVHVMGVFHTKQNPRKLPK